MNKQSIKNKRSQEEMVGFILIIVLVTIIALVFLFLNLGKKEAIKSKEVENFLHSSLLLTTSCQPSSEIYYDLKDIIYACYKNEKCLDNTNACDTLNSTFSQLIESSFPTGKESKHKGYILNINKTSININKGNFTSNYLGSDIIIPVEDENFNINLKIFY